MSDGLSLHFTQPDADLGAKIKATPSGMAFWAGTGPDLMTCRQCRFFDHQNSYYAKSGMRGGILKPARCKKFSLLAQRNGDKIPHDTRACKYFEQSEKIPPVVSR